MLRLIFRHLSGSRQGTVEVYSVQRLANLRIGRDPSCDLRFHPEQDVLVSRHHALIEWTGGEGEGETEDTTIHFNVVDLLSSNGTFLNGQPVPVEGAELHHNDRLQFGRGGPELVLAIDSAATVNVDGELTSRPISQTQEMPAMTVLHKAAPKFDSRS
jgi:pSer/pThr/pTyr-binding forkhead associated (FHA) protein